MSYSKQYYNSIQKPIVKNEGYDEEGKVRILSFNLVGSEIAENKITYINNYPSGSTKIISLGISYPSGLEADTELEIKLIAKNPNLGDSDITLISNYALNIAGEYKSFYLNKEVLSKGGYILSLKFSNSLTKELAEAISGYSFYVKD